MPPTTFLLRPSWVEMGLGIIEQNAREIRRIVGPASAFIASVKAYGYGYGTLPVVQATFGVPFISLKSCIIQVIEVPTGYNVSGTVTRRRSLIATIPIGHADGYASVHAGGHVLVRGMRVPICLLSRW